MIYYQFYDPTQTGRFPKGKLRIIQGMNAFHTLAERQDAVKALIEVELNELKILGFNPIAEKHSPPIDVAVPISPNKPLMEALHKALAKANM